MERRIVMEENNGIAQKEIQLRRYILGISPLSDEECKNLPFLFLEKMDVIIERLNFLSSRIDGRL